MNVQAAMTANPACCVPTTSLQAVAAMMVEHDCGQIPVIDDPNSKNLLGVVTDRDIAVRMVAQGKNTMDAVAADCMTTPCVSVPSDTSLENCCQVMEASKIRRVPVTDASGALCGIVSLADVVRCASAESSAELVKEVSSGTNGLSAGWGNALRNNNQPAELSR